jgi:C1A family cysteine protease
MTGMKLKRVLLIVSLMIYLALCSCGNVDDPVETTEAPSEVILNTEEPVEFVVTEDPEILVTEEPSEDPIETEEPVDEEEVKYSSHATGLQEPTLEEMKEIASRQVTTSSAQYTALPYNYDNSRNYPTPRSQGAQGSCTAWAAAYALRSLQEWEEHGWDYSEDHLYSPSFVYNLGNGGEDSGMSIVAALKILENYGAATLDVMPYNPNDYLTQPGDLAKNLAWENRIASWQAVQGVNSIKNAILNFGGAIVGVPIYPEFNVINADNPVYDDMSGIQESSHAICLVGWDNGIQAFKFINSWGTEWGIDGFGWISYEIVNTANYAYYMVDVNGNLNRNKYIISFALGDAGVMRDIVVEEGVSQVLPKCEGVKPGKVFSGWWLGKYDRDKYIFYFKNKATGEVIWRDVENRPENYEPTVFEDSAEILLKDLTPGAYSLVPTWKDQEVQEISITVKFDANKGEGFMADLASKDGSFRLPNSTFTRAGYKFKGWWLRRNDTYWYVENDIEEEWEMDVNCGWHKPGEEPPNYHAWEIGDGSTFYISESDMQLVAIWEPLDEITLHIGTYEEEALKKKTEKLKILGEIKLGGELAVEIKGKTFKGWSMYDMNSSKYKYASSDLVYVGWHSEGEQPLGFEKFLYQPNVSYEGFTQEYGGREFLLIPEYDSDTSKEFLYFKDFASAKVPDFSNFGGGYELKNTSILPSDTTMYNYHYESTSDSNSRIATVDDYIAALKENGFALATHSSNEEWFKRANITYELNYESLGSSLNVTAWVSEDAAVILTSYRNVVSLEIYGDITEFTGVNQ